MKHYMKPTQEKSPAFWTNDLVTNKDCNEIASSLLSLVPKKDNLKCILERNV